LSHFVENWLEAHTLRHSPRGERQILNPYCDILRCAHKKYILIYCDKMRCAPNI
jgi:hypothetical protein